MIPYGKQTLDETDKLGEKVFAIEYFPKEIRANRRMLQTYLALAERIPTICKDALVEDRLILDGKTCTADRGLCPSNSPKKPLPHKHKARSQHSSQVKLLCLITTQVSLKCRASSTTV